MSEPHDQPVLYRGADGALHDLHFDPSPAEALPQQTFATSYQLQANGETLALQHVAPAHTDTDIYVHFQNANVIQMGDLFFNGMYPYIDPGTGGKIDGMIAAADTILSLARNDTKIVAGHGPLGNKADLTKSLDMLVTARDRIQKLKSAEICLEAVAERPPVRAADQVVFAKRNFHDGTASSKSPNRLYPECVDPSGRRKRTLYATIGLVTWPLRYLVLRSNRSLAP